jgi:heterodisulfide reductase subunit A-like polyferredoxin
MYLKGKYPKMEGANITINEDLCDGCKNEEVPLCLEVCIYGGMEVIDGLAVNDREGKNRCKACGRCERVCPKGAITITIEEDSVERMIARIETSVDVSQNFVKR